MPIRLTPAPDYVVNPGHPNSSDTGPGSVERPFKTLAAAVQKSKPGVTVHVYPSVYREKIELTADGTPEAPIRFEGVRGPRGEWPVITGNVPFPTNAWSAVPGLTGVSSARPPFKLNEAPQGPSAGFLTEFLVLDPLPAKSQPSVFVRLPGDINPNTVTVDLSAQLGTLVNLAGRHTSFRGFEVRHGAHFQQRALVDISGAGALLEGCWIHDGEVRGVTVTAKSEPGRPPFTIRGNLISRTGHVGIGGLGNSITSLNRCSSEPSHRSRRNRRPWKLRRNHGPNSRQTRRRLDHHRA